MQTHELPPPDENGHVTNQEVSTLLSSNLPLGDTGPPRNDQSELLSHLGRYHLALLASSSTVCFSCVTFLTFLWAADTKNTIWLRIVLDGWTTRSVTMASLVLRWATAAQATLCTSMLAAVLLKAGAIHIPAAAAISIMKYDNNGPWTLLGLMGVKWCHGSIPISILAMLSLTTLLLQLSSTILLSQVGTEPLPVTSTVGRTYYGFDVEGRSYMKDTLPISFLHRTPIEYPAFAEWTSNESSTSSSAWQKGFTPSISSGIRDTGTVMRAFLPIRDAAECSLMIDYQGIGTVVDTRVVCVRPKLIDVVFSTDEGYHLIGKADVDTEPAGLMRNADSSESGSLAFSFVCSFAAHHPRILKTIDTWTWPLAICSGADPISKQGIYSVMSTETQREIGQSYIIANATLADSVTTLDESDVWASTTLRANDSSMEPVTVQVTLCMTAFEAQELEVHATRSPPIFLEPRISWSIPKATYDTMAVVQQLDPTKSTEERGLFSLTPRAWEWVNRTESFLTTSGRHATTEALSMVRGRIYDRMVNVAQYQVFARIVTSTGNPALALQAYFTTLCAIAYRDHIITFDKAAPSTRVTLVEATRPTGWSGYIIVVSAVFLHLILVALVVMLFCRAGKLGRMGNAWATISQLLRPATESWIRDTNAVGDRALKKWLKFHGKHNTLVQLEEVDNQLLLVCTNKP